MVNNLLFFLPSEEATRRIAEVTQGHHQGLPIVVVIHVHEHRLTQEVVLDHGPRLGEGG